MNTAVHARLRTRLGAIIGSGVNELYVQIECRGYTYLTTYLRYNIYTRKYTMVVENITQQFMNRVSIYVNQNNKKMYLTVFDKII